MLASHPVETVRAKLLVLREQLATGTSPVKNVAGWLRRAIEEDYQAPQPLESAAPAAAAAAKPARSAEQSAWYDQLDEAVRRKQERQAAEVAERKRQAAGAR